MSTPLLVVLDVVPPLRLVPTPAWEPPYTEPGEDVLAVSGCESAGRASTQGTLDLTFLLPTGLPVEPERSPLRLLAPARSLGGGEPGDDVFDPQPTSRADLPDPRFWAGRLAQAMLEVDAGVRPVAQLRRWTSDVVYARLRRRSQRNRFSQDRATQPSRVWVRSLRICEPADGIAEVSAVVQDSGRTRAMAMRLEGTDGRWRCTALEQT